MYGIINSEIAREDLFWSYHMLIFLCTEDMNPDQEPEPEVAVGYSVGIIEDLNGGERYAVSNLNFD